MIEATKREVLEEIGCEVELLPSKRTLFCELENPVFKEYELHEKIPPLLIYNSDTMEMSVCVYMAKIRGEPEPKQEVPALLLLDMSLLKGGISNELITNGGTLKTQQFVNIPVNTMFIPFGSVELLANHYEKFNNIADFDRLFGFFD